MLTLIAWGALADRYGERLALAAGMGSTAAAGFATAEVVSEQRRRRVPRAGASSSDGFRPNSVDWRWEFGRWRCLLASPALC
ncbi:hypothetical protein ACFVW2_36165 [Streptomyces sp. NPDC058171]